MGKRKMIFYMIISSFALISCFNGRELTKHVEDMNSNSMSQDFWENDKIQWGKLSEKRMCIDSCELMHDYIKYGILPEFYPKRLVINNRTFVCSLFPYGSGLPIWGISVYEQENGKLRQVANGKVVKNKMLTADFDSLSRAIVFLPCDIEWNDTIKKCKIVKKSYSIGCLYIDDL